MSKYKVGDTFFVESIVGRDPKNGYAKITKVGQKYADIKFLDKSENGEYRVSMEKNCVFDSAGYKVGEIYQSKDAYEVATGIKKAAREISDAMYGHSGYSKLLGKSIDDLKRIAEMLDIDLS